MKTWNLLRATSFAVIILMSRPVIAQSDSSAELRVAQEDSPQTVAEVESLWRFGLKINSQGQASGIIGTSPVPIECPEQTVELIEEERLGGVGKIKISPLKPDARQIVFKINRMEPSSDAMAAVRFRIIKRDIEAPEETDRFKFVVKPRGVLKTYYLGESPFIETDEKKVIEIAEMLQEKNAELSPWDQVEAIYTWVRENVEYKFDTQIHTCAEALESGIGDCEELSSLFIAICRVQNIPARAVWVPGHTYPEFYLEDEKGDGHWFPCQAAGSYQFGSMSESRPVLQKGDRFKVSGQRELLRYAQPTLKCKNATAGIGIEQIAEKVE